MPLIFNSSSKNNLFVCSAERHKSIVSTIKLTLLPPHECPIKPQRRIVCRVVLKLLSTDVTALRKRANADARGGGDATFYHHMFYV